MPPNRPPRSPSIIPAPLSVIPAQAGTTHPNTHPFPNSSLPPGRGEVRWGVGGHEPSPPSRARPDRSPHSPSAQSRVPQSPLRSPSVIPAPPSVIPAQAGTHAPPRVSHHAHQPPSSHPFPNSSLPPSRGEVRWGVGGHEPPPPSRAPRSLTPPSAQSRAPQSLTPLPLRPVARPDHSPHSPSVIPAPPLRHSCAGRNHAPPRASHHAHQPPSSHPFPNSSLPPSSRPSRNPLIRRCRPIVPIWSGYRLAAKFGVVRRSASRGEVRWGVGGHEPSPSSRARPNRPPHSPPPSRAPLNRPPRSPSAQSRAPQSPTSLPLHHSRALFRHSCAPLRHSCVGRNPRASDIRRRSSALSEVDEGQPAPSSTSSSS